ncbi:site-specific recombinase, phage integrase family [Streptococcus pneumoniae 2081074]|nr:site-specific recombinase, phage integrase family [Streptococcus pneumoniae 2081074]
MASFLVCFLIFIEYYSYGSYLWHNNIDLGVIAKILGHKDISMLIDVYGHTLEEKISEEFMAVKSLL